MSRTKVKRVFLFLSIFIGVSLACNVSANFTPTNGVPSAATTPIHVVESPTLTPEIFISLTQAMPATVVPTTAQLVDVTVFPVTISLSPGLATDIRGSQIPSADGQDVPYWELTPGHTVLDLEGYLLQGKFHAPQIYVYPAQAYAEMHSGAFESIRRLDNILYGPDGPNINNLLPAVPFFNAAQVFASNIQVLSFQNGQGVRFLTEYAQYAAPVNNHELFYHFQGLTGDGEYYIIAILPITAPVLAETSDAGAVLPPGGIAYPDINNPHADWPGYYTTVTARLDATSPEVFAPTINQLDLLIESIRITP